MQLSPAGTAETCGPGSPAHSPSPAGSHTAKDRASMSAVDTSVTHASRFPLWVRHFANDSGKIIYLSVRNHPERINQRSPVVAEVPSYGVSRVINVLGAVIVFYPENSSKVFELGHRCSIRVSFFTHLTILSVFMNEGLSHANRPGQDAQPALRDCPRLGRDG